MSGLLRLSRLYPRPGYNHAYLGLYLCTLQKVLVVIYHWLVYGAHIALAPIDQPMHDLDLKTSQRQATFCIQRACPVWIALADVHAITLSGSPVHRHVNEEAQEEETLAVAAMYIVIVWYQLLPRLLYITILTTSILR